LIASPLQVEDAYRQVKGRLDLAVTDLGPTQLKNIAEPVRAYSLQVGVPAKLAIEPKALEPKKRSMLAPFVTGIVALIVIAAGGWYFLGANRTAVAAHLSIVVLPFTNLSNDPAQDYFADGVTENLTTDLSRIRGSFVIARNTAFTFKGKGLDAKEIGKQLDVRYVLEGSVQRDPGRMRVNVQLIDAESGKHLWAERFDKPLANLFDMQDEIVARLANQLGTKLTAAEARHAERTPNPDSIDLYLQGMAWANKGVTAEYQAQARSFFERALALDSGNIEALVGTARVDAIIAAAFLTEDRAGHFAAAEATLTKVLSLAPNNAWAHFWMGMVQNQTNRAAQGIAEFNRALALDPNLAAAPGETGMAELYSGHGEETEAQENEALRLSPRDGLAFIWMLQAGAAKVHLGANDEAVAWLRRSLDANRNLPTTHFILAAALANLGKLDEARAETEAGLALNPTFAFHRSPLPRRG